MERVIFEGSWQAYFHRLGMSAFDDFFNRSDVLTVGKNARRDVQCFTLDDDGDRQVFFMKRFRRPQLKDVFGAACRFGRLTSQARVEWDNARHLLQNGIDTYRPVCMGERCRMGLETESFFVTQQLESTCLVDFLLDRWAMLDRATQDGIVVAMGRFARRIHDLNMSIPDLYLWHLYLREEALGADQSLSIIDLHRMTQKAPNSRERAHALGRLYWSLSPDYFDDQQKALLLATYMEGLSAARVSALTRAIRRHVATLETRRKLARYYKPSATCASDGAVQ